MPYRLLVLIVACVGFAAAASSSGDDEWKMRWRICADYSAGFAFRYPYEYFIPEQYASELVRERRGKRVAMREITVNGKRAFVMDEAEAGPEGVDVKAFSFVAGALPAGVAATVDAVGAHVLSDPKLALAAGDRALTWNSFCLLYTSPSPRD